MRGIWLTFLPLLAAAALTLWGGERLARREVETRTPADRERLHDFSDALRTELDRLDDLHHGHLTKIAGDAPFAVPEIIAKACTQVAGTRECHVFQGKAKSHAAIGSRPPDPAVRLPEVEVAGGKRPLNSQRSVILPAELLEAENIGASGIIRETGGLHEIRWFLPGLDHLVAFTIDPAELRQRVDTHLREWLAGPFAPLRESGELVSLTGPGDVPLVTLPASSRTSSPSLAASARPSNSAPPPASPTRWWKACSPSSSPRSSAAR